MDWILEQLQTNLVQWGLSFVITAAVAWIARRIETIRWSIVITIAAVTLASSLVIFDQLKGSFPPSPRSTIRDWLDQSLYSVKSVPVSTGFRFDVKDPTDKPILIVVDDNNNITLTIVMIPDELFREKWESLDKRSRSRIISNVKIELLKLGVGYRNLNTEYDQVRLEDKFAFTHEMTQLEFLQRLFFVRRARDLLTEFTSVQYSIASESGS